MYQESLTKAYLSSTCDISLTWFISLLKSASITLVLVVIFKMHKTEAKL